MRGFISGIADIEEPQDLWKGIEVVDRSGKGCRKVFNSKSILMWTLQRAHLMEVDSICIP